MGFADRKIPIFHIVYNLLCPLLLFRNLLQMEQLRKTKQYWTKAANKPYIGSIQKKKIRTLCIVYNCFWCSFCTMASKIIYSSTRPTFSAFRFNFWMGFSTKWQWCRIRSIDVRFGERFFQLFLASLGMDQSRKSGDFYSVDVVFLSAGLGFVPQMRSV